MNFGFALPGRGPLAKPDLLLKLAEAADRLRYASIFVADHVVLPTVTRSRYPYHASGKMPGGPHQDYLEPLTLLSHLAAATKKIRLGTSVLVIPYRNPVLTAKMLATLDLLSGGRVILGAGAGWLEEEFVALGAPPFPERGRVTEEYLRLMRECWTKDEIRFEGKHYRVSQIAFLPKPVQKGGIPVWLGGHSDAVLRRVGELADGWHPIGLRPPGSLLPAEYGDKVKQIHAWAGRAGREPGAITLSLRVPMEVLGRRVKAPAGDRGMFCGGADQVIADIRQYQDLGVTHFVFDFTVPELRSALANMERFAEEVLPKVRRVRR